LSANKQAEYPFRPVYAFLTFLLSGEMTPWSIFLSLSHNYYESMKKKIFPLIISFFILFLSSSDSIATGPPGPPMGPTCWPPPCTIPIDGGISFLIAAGVALGGKKIYDSRKKSE